jgi:hypothetical protein
VAAPQKFPAVHEQLRELALEARREGLSFDEFWQRAVRPGRYPVLTWRHVGRPASWVGEWPPLDTVRWPNDTHDRQIALEVHRDPVVVKAWRAAYYGQDSDTWMWCGPLVASPERCKSPGPSRTRRRFPQVLTRR